MPSPSRSYKRSRSRSRSRSPYRGRSSYRDRSPRRSRSPHERRRRSPLRSGRRSSPPHRSGQKRYQWGREEEEKKEEEPVEKEQPNFGLSGKLAAETNTVKGVELKYNEPPEAAKPKQKWRLYVFKGKEQVDLLHIHRQSSYLIGRDRVVADIPIDHPSCSKQHAVIQYRQMDEKDENGKLQKITKPFIIDLEATNGTFLNGEQIPSTRFVELKATDVLKFGSSTRDYVLLHAEQ
ncbi:hypothetical protein G6F37_000374 [Rhizopus arrhizus]|nr:hypothetical protein G6F38_002298 [Rhizopus arrhizus]KAG1164350.1 hypothetical protein G6F37_000374 [Rhizopus arrhizus]